MGRWDSHRNQPLNPDKPVPVYNVTDEEKARWNGKQDALKYDLRPTPNSPNALRSAAVYAAIESAKNILTNAYRAYFTGAAEGLGQVSTELAHTQEAVDAAVEQMTHLQEQIDAATESTNLSAEQALSYRNGAADSAAVAEQHAQEAFESASYVQAAVEKVQRVIPAGGTTSQVLIKSSDADYETEWKDGVLNVEYSNDVSKITLWENGTIDYKGQLISGNTRLRNRQYLDATDNLVIHINDNNYEYGICLYSDIDTQIETEKFYFDANSNTNVQYAVYYQRDVTGAELLEAFPSLKYIKVVMRNVQSETTISPSDYDKITLDYKNDTYSLITYLNKIQKIITESSGFIKIKNAINSLAAIWAKWNGRLAFGMDTTKANVPLEVDGQIYAEGTIIAHNGGTQATNRWGAHIYEGYAKDNYSRMTMLLDKHPSEVNGKPSLEYYYYTGAGHRATDYGNTKIGSDAQYHSFFFNRDEFICVGLADFRFPITLWRVNPSTLNRNYSTVADLDAHVDAETQAGVHLSSLRYIYLKNAENGTMFYDTARNKVVCKINGAWCDLAYTDASSNYSYL